MDWMDNPILCTWYLAVHANPEPFHAVAITHDILCNALPATAAPAALSIRLHQEWHLFAQLWWDTIFASLTSTQKKFTQVQNLGARFLDDASSSFPGDPLTQSSAILSFCCCQPKAPNSRAWTFNGALCLSSHLLLSQHTSPGNNCSRPGPGGNASTLCHSRTYT